jgi:hypothetical protein
VEVGVEGIEQPGVVAMPAACARHVDTDLDSDIDSPRSIAQVPGGVSAAQDWFWATVNVTVNLAQLAGRILDARCRTGATNALDPNRPPKAGGRERPST